MKKMLKHMDLVRSAAAATGIAAALALGSGIASADTAPVSDAPGVDTDASGSTPVRTVAPTSHAADTTAAPDTATTEATSPTSTGAPESSTPPAGTGVGNPPIDPTPSGTVTAPSTTAASTTSNTPRTTPLTPPLTPPVSSTAAPTPAPTVAPEPGRHRTDEVTIDVSTLQNRPPSTGQSPSNATTPVLYQSTSGEVGGESARTGDPASPTGNGALVLGSAVSALGVLNRRPRSDGGTDALPDPLDLSSPMSEATTSDTNARSVMAVVEPNPTDDPQRLYTGGVAVYPAGITYSRGDGFITIYNDSTREVGVTQGRSDGGTGSGPAFVRLAPGRSQTYVIGAVPSQLGIAVYGTQVDPTDSGRIVKTSLGSLSVYNLADLKVVFSVDAGSVSTGRAVGAIQDRKWSILDPQNRFYDPSDPENRLDQFGVRVPANTVFDAATTSGVSYTSAPDGSFTVYNDSATDLGVLVTNNKVGLFDDLVIIRPSTSHTFSVIDDYLALTVQKPRSTDTTSTTFDRPVFVGELASYRDRDGILRSGPSTFGIRDLAPIPNRAWLIADPSNRYLDFGDSDITASSSTALTGAVDGISYDATADGTSIRIANASTREVGVTVASIRGYSPVGQGIYIIPAGTYLDVPMDPTGGLAIVQNPRDTATGTSVVIGSIARSPGSTTTTSLPFGTNSSAIPAADLSVDPLNQFFNVGEDGSPYLFPAVYQTADPGSLGVSYVTGPDGSVTVYNRGTGPISVTAVVGESVESFAIIAAGASSTVYSPAAQSQTLARAASLSTTTPKRGFVIQAPRTSSGTPVFLGVIVVNTDGSVDSLPFGEGGTSIPGGANTPPVIVVTASPTGPYSGTIDVSDADAIDTDLEYSTDGGEYGTVVFGEDGSYTYTPNAGVAHGASAPGGVTSDSFTVYATDGRGGESSQVVTITITPENTAPTVTATPGPTDSTNGAVTYTLLGSDTDGDTVTFTVTSDPTHGTVRPNIDGTITYTPDVAYRAANSYTDSFTVTANDGHGGSVTTTITPQVVSPTPPPTTPPITPPATPQNPIIAFFTQLISGFFSSVTAFFTQIWFWLFPQLRA